MNTIRTNPIASTTGLGRASLLAAALFTALLCGACGGEEGTTPTCEQDIVDGEHKNVGDKGCNPFATCEIAPKDPHQCCKNVGGGDMNSFDYQACMYGYGAGPEPGTK